MTPGSDQVPDAHGRTVRILVALMASLSLLVAIVGGVSYATYRAAETTGTKQGFQDPDPSAAPSDQPTGPCVRGVCNYLILGSDSRAGLSAKQQDEFGTNADIGGENRADTIMLVHSDPSRQKAVILSFPRDLWVDIPGHGYDKINAAFQGGIDGGGPELVAKTVHELTGLKINHFVYVDLAGFQHIVETLNGVDMCIPAENVNTPGWVEGPPPGGPIYYKEPGYIADPYTGLHVKPGCQTLPADQALAYVRTRHLPCDNIPDFARINRQQEFLRSVINTMLQPSELLRAPTLVRPVLESLQRDRELSPADLAFLVAQMRGMTTGAAEFRSVPGTPITITPPGWTGNLDIVKMDPAAKQIFAALRTGKPLPAAGTSFAGVEPSAATIAVPVVDHDSAGKATAVNQVVSDAGFIATGVVPFDTFGAKVKGSVIAYEPGHEDEAQVVAKYFPDLKFAQTKSDALTGSDVAVFVTSSYVPEQPGTGGSAPTCA
jgi:anionic cell wall polymer biosynthesis LytR-Cps2A-Psr (LCP) family protein